MLAPVRSEALTVSEELAERLGHRVSESHLAREVRLELAAEGLILHARYGRHGGPTFQVIDQGGNLVAGDPYDGWVLTKIEMWAWPDLARWTPDLIA